MLFRPSVGLAAMTIPAQAAGDAKNGEQIFNQCKPCHSLEADKNGIGPTLHGLLGRKAGTVPGYSYSPAMQSSGIVWNEDSLAKYLADPSAVVPGTKMVYARIKNEVQCDDLIASQGGHPIATRRKALLARNLDWEPIMRPRPT